MSPPGAAAWHPERFCFIAAAPSASTGVTARDKVDRLEARTAFRAPEPDVLREAVAEPGAPQAVVVAGPGAPFGGAAGAGAGAGAGTRTWGGGRGGAPTAAGGAGGRAVGV